MRRSDEPLDRWYLRLLAAPFTFFCGISTVRYLWMDLTNNGHVAVLAQFLCVALTAASTLYFIRPRLGHHLLLGLAIFTLLFVAPTAPEHGTGFWLFTLGLLLLPYLHPPTATPRLAP